MHFEIYFPNPAACWPSKPALHSYLCRFFSCSIMCLHLFPFLVVVKPYTTTTLFISAPFYPAAAASPGIDAAAPLCVRNCTCVFGGAHYCGGYLCCCCLCSSSYRCCHWRWRSSSVSTRARRDSSEPSAPTTRIRRSAIFAGAALPVIRAGAPVLKLELALALPMDKLCVSLQVP